MTQNLIKIKWPNGLNFNDYFECCRSKNTGANHPYKIQTKSAACTTAAMRRHCKSTLKKLLGEDSFQNIAQKASVITVERFSIKNCSDYIKMTKIRTDKRSLHKPPTELEKVGMSFSSWLISTRACAWADIVPLTPPSLWESSKTGTFCQTISPLTKLTLTNLKKA